MGEDYAGQPRSRTGSRRARALRPACRSISKSSTAATQSRAKPAGVPVTRLALTDFRSYATALIEPGPGFVLLSGDNGAGKTNMLEAVSLLTPGRGLARRIAGRDGAERRAGRVWGRGAARRYRHRHRHDRGRARAAAGADQRRGGSGQRLSEWLSVLWLTPAMDRLFADSAGARRRFLDRLVLALEPGHAHHAARYEAAMRARNKLLAEPRQRRSRLARGAGGGDGRAWRGGCGRRAPGPSPRSTSGSPTRPTSDFATRRAGARRLGRRRSRRRAQGQPRPRRRGRPRDCRAAPPGPRCLPPRQGHAGGAILDRRAEGAAAGTRPRPCRAGRGTPRRTADPAARRGRRPSRSRPARGVVRTGSKGAARCG